MCSVQAFKDSKALYNRPSAIFEQCFEPLNGSKSIQSVNNDAWKQRKKLLHGLIRGDNLESFFHCFVEIACEKAAAWTPGKPIVLMKEMFQMPLKALLNTSLGNIFEDNNGINELANLYHQCKCEMDERILEAPPPNSQQELDFQKTLKRLIKLILKRLYHSWMRLSTRELLMTLFCLIWLRFWVAFIPLPTTPLGCSTFLPNTLIYKRNCTKTLLPKLEMTKG